MSGPPAPSTAGIFDGLPETLPEEIIDVLVQSGQVRIERILSQGHCSPESGWYDQAENEWVLVVRGSGRIEFEDGRQVTLNPGDHVDIPAGCLHRVVGTDPEQITVWLAVFYQGCSTEMQAP